MGPGTNPMIIDVHCHVVSPDRVKYPLAPIGGKQSDWSSERPTTPEQLIAAMDAAGVAKAAVVQGADGTMVYTVVGEQVASVPVKLGTEAEKGVEAIEGLKGDETLIVSPLEKVTIGARVVAVQK